MANLSACSKTLLLSALSVALVSCETLRCLRQDDATCTVSAARLRGAFSRFWNVTRGGNEAHPAHIRSHYAEAFLAVSMLERESHIEAQRVTRRYADSLENELRVVERVARQPVPTPHDEQMLSGAVRSLKVKARHAAASQTDWAELVQMTVNTKKKNGESVQHLEVWYCPSGWADDFPHWKRFNNLSTPTTEALAPGDYVVCAGRPDTVLQRTPMTVGGDGQPRDSFDLIVP